MYPALLSSIKVLSDYIFWLFIAWPSLLLLLGTAGYVRRVVSSDASIGKWYQKDPEGNAWRVALSLTLPRLAAALLFLFAVWLTHEEKGIALWLFFSFSPEGFSWIILTGIFRAMNSSFLFELSSVLLGSLTPFTFWWVFLRWLNLGLYPKRN